MFLKKLRKSSFKKRWKDEEKSTTTDNDVCGDCNIGVADVCFWCEYDEVRDDKEKESE